MKNYLVFENGDRIGGANLIDGTIEPLIVEGTDTSSYEIIDYGAEPETTYTVSGTATLEEGSGSVFTIHACYKNDALAKEIAFGDFTYTFTTPATITSTSDEDLIWKMLIYPGKTSATSGNKISIKDLKIEKGSAPTGWAPSAGDFKDLLDRIEALEEAATASEEE